MLSKRENLLETIRNGKPDRFVKQFEARLRRDHIICVTVGR